MTRVASATSFSKFWFSLFSLCPFDPVFGFGAFFSLKVFFGACGVGRVGDGGLAGGPWVVLGGAFGAKAGAGGGSWRPGLGPVFERRGSKFKAAMKADGAEARDVGSSGNRHLEICVCPDSATAVPASCEAEHAVSAIAEVAFFPSFWFLILPQTSNGHASLVPYACKDIIWMFPI